MQLICDPDHLPYVSRWQAHFEIVCESGATQRGLHLRYQGRQLLLCRGAESPGISTTRKQIERRHRGDLSLARACGVKRGRQLKILDATAGLGVDGLALAAMGNRVTLVERNIVLWALLDDLLLRLPAAGASLIWGEAADVLGTLQTARAFDVVYLDPMFPPRSKSALPGKAMQWLSELLGGTSGGSPHPPDQSGLNADQNLPELLELSRKVATERVVLKRRLKSPVLFEPDWQIRGKTIRYDVYRP